MGVACCKFGGEETWYRTMVWKSERDEMREISGLPAELLACQDGSCPMQSATCLTFTGPTSRYIPLRSTLYQVHCQAQTHTEFYEVIRLVIAMHILSCDWYYSLKISDVLENYFRPDCKTRLILASDVYSICTAKLQKIQEEFMICHLHRELVWAVNKDWLLEFAMRWPTGYGNCLSEKAKTWLYISISN